MKKKLFILVLVSLWFCNQAQLQNDKPFKKESEEREFKEEFVKPITLLPHQLTRTKEEVERELSVVHENENPLAKTSSIGTWDCVGPYYYYSRIKPLVRPISYKTTGRIRKVQYQGNRMVALTSNAGVWANNGGASWTKLTSNLTCNIAAFTTIKGSNTYLVIGTGNYLNSFSGAGSGGLASISGTGIYYTNPISSTGWSQASMSPSIPSFINSIVCDTNYLDTQYDDTHGNQMYCGTSNGLYYSADQGRTWNQDPATSGKFITKVYVDGNSKRLYYSVRGEGLYRKPNFSLSSPSTFIYTLPSVTSPLSHVELGFNPKNNASFYAEVYDSNNKICSMLKTYNYGQTWIPCPVTEIGLSPSYTFASQYHTNAICVSLSDTNKVMLGSISLYKSSNGYNFLWCSNLHNDINDIDVVKGTDKFWVACDGGISKYDFSLDTHDDIYNNLPIIEGNNFDINKLNSESPTMVLGTQDNGVIFKTPLANKWFANSRSFSDGADVLVHPFSHDTMLVNEGLGISNLFYTYEATSNNFLNIPSITSDHDKRLLTKNYAYPIKYYAVDFTTSPNCVINYKQSLTAPWVSIGTSASLLYCLAVSPGANSTIYYTRENSYFIYRKSPFSSFFTAIFNPVPSGNLKTFYPHDNWLVSYTSGGSISSPAHVEFSTNYGSSFYPINTNSLPPTTFINDILINPYNSNHVYLATSKGVYATTDNGITWNLIDNNMPLDAVIKQLDYVDFMATSGYITVYASTFGNSIWKRDFAVTPLPRDLAGLEQISNNEVTDYLTLEQPYLDQNNLLNLNYFVGKDQNLQINMYDASGKQVLTIKNGNVNMGNYNDKLDVSQLAKGIYVVTLTGSEKTIRKKWIL